MDPKFQTSFIPKKPVVQSNAPSAVTPSQLGTGIFSTFTNALFITTLIVMGGLFGYKKILEADISNADKQLIAARDAFQPDTIDEIVAVSARINAIKKLLNDHVAISQLFSLLQSLTIKHVRLSNLSYKNDSSGNLTLTADVEAQSYNALFQQSQILLRDSFVSNVGFADFDVSETGTITAKLVANIDPSLLSYKKAIESLAPTTTTVVETKVDVSTTSPNTQ